MPTLTIELTTEQWQRFSTALGRMQDYREANGTPRDATVAEAKQYILGCARKPIQKYEIAIKQQQIVVDPWNPE